MKQVPLSEVKDDLSRFLRETEKQDIVITRYGKPAGVLIGFESEDDWFDYRLKLRFAVFESRATCAGIPSRRAPREVGGSQELTA
jgi:prevent-host-death family protein